YRPRGGERVGDRRVSLRSGAGGARSRRSKPGQDSLVGESGGLPGAGEQAAHRGLPGGFASLAAQPDPTEPGRSSCGSRGSRETGKGPDRALQAARLFGAAAVLREAANAPLAARHRAEYERQVAAARALLDPASFAAAWAEGQAMTLDEAVAYALAAA